MQVKVKFKRLDQIQIIQNQNKLFANGKITWKNVLGMKRILDILKYVIKFEDLNFLKLYD